MSSLQDVTCALLPLEKAQLALMRLQGTGKLSAELSREKLQGERKSVTELQKCPTLRWEGEQKQGTVLL